MKMPSMIAAFVKAKNDRDSNAVVGCFADNAERVRNTGRGKPDKWHKA
jgi:hypothetical protein